MVIIAIPETINKPPKIVSKVIFSSFPKNIFISIIATNGYVFATGETTDTGANFSPINREFTPNAEDIPASIA